MTKEKNILITQDAHMKTGVTTHVDRDIMSMKKESMITVSSEQLEVMGRLAHERMKGFEAAVRRHLTKEQAERVYQLRVNEKYSWRAVAETCYYEWRGNDWEDADWFPPSNQLMGMALCQQAEVLLNKKID